MGEIVDKRQMFYEKKGPRANQEQWLVTINVPVTWQFFWKVTQAFVRRKQLIINHTFKHDPVRRK